MLWATLLCLLGVTSVAAHQVRLATFDTHIRGTASSPEADRDFVEWCLDEIPIPNSTNHLVFETVYSLLQQWSNTRMRNGHSIVPGSIPKGTLLYHGTGANTLPPGPEWVSTDPEHSYFFCRLEVADTRQACWHLTLVTTRALKIVYFDGSSATKTVDGAMDTQDLLIWGALGSGDMMQVDARRIKDICDWGKNFNVDGFVRMEMDFEVMLCDFTSGVSVVSFSRIAVEGGPFDGLGPTNTMFEVMVSGSWHNRLPGETRVQLDLAGLISFYDTQLVPSLIDIRFGQERWDHRVRNASAEDLSAVKSRLEAALVRPAGTSSGIDWKTLVQVIVDRYAGRLDFLRYFLISEMVGPDEIIDIGKKVQIQLRNILAPYIFSSATPVDPSNKTGLHWASPIYEHCATIHTESFMESELDSMTDSEKLLLRAVRGTTREICRVITKMWATGVSAGLDAMLNTKESPDVDEVISLWTAWREKLSRLMAWLDWSVWVKCDPGCGPHEMCWLPTWPIGFPHPNRPPPGFLLTDDPRSEKMRSNHAGDEVHDQRAIKGFTEQRWNDIRSGLDWVRPQPRCIDRMGPDYR